MSERGAQAPWGKNEFDAFVRVDNVEGNEHCRFCCAEHPGLIVVMRRDAYRMEQISKRNIDGSVSKIYTKTDVKTGLVDEYGPCPMCEIGRRLEYPTDHPGPWGVEGFWRGIRPVIQPNCVCDKPALPTRDAVKVIREYLDRLVVAGEEKSRSLEPPGAEHAREKLFAHRDALLDELASKTGVGEEDGGRSAVSPDESAPVAAPVEEPITLL